MLLAQRRGGGPPAARRRPRSPVRRRRRPPRRRKMYLFYHSLLRLDRGRMARVVFFDVFWSEISAKGRFSRRPFHYLALLKYRVKNGVFRVFFSVCFRQLRVWPCRRAAGEVFCPRVASGPRDTAMALPE